MWRQDVSRVVGSKRPPAAVLQSSLIACRSTLDEQRAIATHLALELTEATQLQKSLSEKLDAINHYPYLRVANVQRGRLKLEEIERFELFDGELERWQLEPGDILVVEGNGSEDEIGRCALWNGEIPNCVHQNHIIRCRPLTRDVQNYVLLFLNSPAGIADMKKRAITTSGLYSLSVGKIRSLVIPIPPLADQKRIVSKATEFMALCDALETKLTQAESASTELLSAAVHHLLNGRMKPIEGFIE